MYVGGDARLEAPENTQYVRSYILSLSLSLFLTLQLNEASIDIRFEFYVDVCYYKVLCNSSMESSRHFRIKLPRGCDITLSYGRRRVLFFWRSR